MKPRHLVSASLQPKPLNKYHGFVILLTLHHVLMVWMNAISIARPSKEFLMKADHWTFRDNVPTAKYLCSSGNPSIHSPLLTCWWIALGFKIMIVDCTLFLQFLSVRQRCTTWTLIALRVNDARKMVDLEVGANFKAWLFYLQFADIKSMCFMFYILG